MEVYGLEVDLEDSNADKDEEELPEERDGLRLVVEIFRVPGSIR
jgi:hypothetical protein